ncbi:YigZ family protein [Corynebacterium hylobatis]|uniref:YigZ family protein n=1 Tax=Corynebacterium hylobatis TaxID=1859290 RepID=A0A3R9ZI92_9CORY|nr:YigZ family protein [Corynebacterium hylobatis]RSZ62116.1 YigZ family protein [Corynebacterium hylobatis]
MLTTYQLPAADQTWMHEWEVKRSRFLSLARRTPTDEAARDFIHEIRAQYPDARHHCSAYLIHVEGSNPVERSSDDGEPSGTAGKPMLDMLKGSGLLDVTVVVVRWFGGIKLGAGGLVHAYSQSVGDLMPQVRRVTRAIRELYRIEVPHADAGRLESDLRARGVSVTDTDYGAAVTYTLAVEPGARAELESTLAALSAGAVIPAEAGTAWIEY